VATSYTNNVKLQKPATADRNWDIPLNANADLLDGLTAIGGLAVTAAETPSASLNVRVAPGAYRKGDGTIGTFAGASTVAMPASSATCLWLTDTGSLTTGTAFPTTAHVRLASVTSSATTISGVADQRVQCSTAGSGLGFILKAGDALADGANFSLGTTTGTQFGTAPNQLLGFFGSKPATQAVSTPALTDSTGATPGTGVTDVGATYSQANINANLATLAAKVNTLIAALKRHGLMSS
jgi:hypothetical protein